METKETERILSEHGVNPTAVRILVYNTVSGVQDTFSLSDVEMMLDTVDKSTVFRTLSLFAERHLLHEVEDGSGSKKYCVCHHAHPCALGRQHCHFRCEVCGKTYCLTGTAVPQLNLPPGFEPHKVEMHFTGVCPRCSVSHAED